MLTEPACWSARSQDGTESGEAPESVNAEWLKLEEECVLPLLCLPRTV